VDRREKKMEKGNKRMEMKRRMRFEVAEIGQEDNEMVGQEILLRVPRIRIPGALPSLPPCGFMEWRSMQYRGNLCS
jgi:hypothetical protein